MLDAVNQWPGWVVLRWAMSVGLSSSDGLLWLVQYGSTRACGDDAFEVKAFLSFTPFSAFVAFMYIYSCRGLNVSVFDREISHTLVVGSVEALSYYRFPCKRLRSSGCLATK